MSNSIVTWGYGAPIQKIVTWGYAGPGPSSQKVPEPLFFRRELWIDVKADILVEADFIITLEADIICESQINVEVTGSIEVETFINTDVKIKIIDEFQQDITITAIIDQSELMDKYYPNLIRKLKAI
jgi:hypothetical protein